MAMTEAHKEALAVGRRESRAVKSYLEALGSRRPGRPVTVESVKKKIAGIEERLDSEGDPLKRLELVQSKLDAEDQLESLSLEADIDELEKEFVSIARSYSERRGISYSAWREVGVSAAVLKDAGVPRTRRG
jgi:hypothetical protein